MDEAFVLPVERGIVSQLKPYLALETGHEESHLVLYRPILSEQFPTNREGDEHNEGYLRFFPSIASSGFEIMSTRAFLGLDNYMLVSVRFQYDQQVYLIAILLGR